MSLEIYRSLPTADVLCEFKMYAVNRELWPTSLQTANCQPCLIPHPGGGGGCCKNCFTVSLPAITDGTHTQPPKTSYCQLQPLSCIWVYQSQAGDSSMVGRIEVRYYPGAGAAVDMQFNPPGFTTYFASYTWKSGSCAGSKYTKTSQTKVVSGVPSVDTLINWPSEVDTVGVPCT